MAPEAPARKRSNPPQRRRVKGELLVAAACLWLAFTIGIATDTLKDLFPAGRASVVVLVVWHGAVGALVAAGLWGLLRERPEGAFMGVGLGVLSTLTSIALGYLVGGLFAP